ncbi:hypothetical protein [Pedobacter gandavensis]|uniref:hypothetical protein n=1 Tax=Pedobacter gandavensis TaxID=2679963 RepID=UPI003D7C2973
MSQYLNEILDKSFSNLISAYRVEKAKKLLETEKNYTIESLEYDSGFSSKSTFLKNNRYDARRVSEIILKIGSIL